MTKYVLDASAVLALIFLEPGWENVDRVLHGSLMSTVNVAEALTKLVQDRVNLPDAVEEISKLNLEIFDFDFESAAKAAELRPLTKHLGLSLGDRACLALAIQHDATAVTADKSWAKLDLCKIELIR
jgi:PIN domain nuclease of toxin-antitoxin system